MKILFSIIGLFVLTQPLLKFGRQMDKLENSETVDSFIQTLINVQWGFYQGLIGLMILGFVCDAGSGYKKPWLLISLIIIGIVWIIIYPHGWFLGVPTLIYSGEKLIKLTRKEKKI